MKYVIPNDFFIQLEVEILEMECTEREGQEFNAVVCPVKTGAGVSVPKMPKFRFR